MLWNEIIGLLAILIGCFFYFVGVLGFARFGDVYLRIQSASIASTLGIAGLLVGAAFLTPSSAPLVIAWAAFMLMTSPVASHAIAGAAYRSGVKMKDPVRDDLEGVVVPSVLATKNTDLESEKSE